MGFFEIYGIGTVISFIVFVFLNHVWFNNSKSALGPPSLGIVLLVTFLSWIGFFCIILIFLIDFLDSINDVFGDKFIGKISKFITGRK